jgi:transposase-like protein
MFDVNDDAKGEFRRVEVLTGPTRRRRWSAEQKARIVEETLAPGARVSEVARRWQVCSQQVFGWRRAAYRAVTTVSAKRPQTPSPDFVPIMTDVRSLLRLNERRHPRRLRSRSKSPVPWCASPPAWMMRLS